MRAVISTIEMCGKLKREAGGFLDSCFTVSLEVNQSKFFDLVSYFYIMLHASMLHLVAVSAILIGGFSIPLIESHDSLIFVA